MKGTETFKQVILNHLQDMVEQGHLSMDKFVNPKKNIDDCITYILNTVKSSGNNGFDDSEIFGMAMHYYDEENVEIGKPIGDRVRVVSNHHVELTEAEKEEAKKAAKEKLIREEQERLKGKKKPTTAPTATKPKTDEQLPGQLSLF